MNFVRARSVIEKLMPVSEITMYSKGHVQELKNLYVWFRVNCENISNHVFRLMKLNELKEERYFNEIAPNDTHVRIEVMSWGHKSFVDLCSLDLENETSSHHYCHNKFRIFDLIVFSLKDLARTKIYSLPMSNSLLCPFP